MADNKDKKVLNVPALRFPEFTEEWEEHYLAEYLDFKNGLNPSANKFGSGIKFISVMDILNNDFITYDCIRTSVEITPEEQVAFAVEKGDMLFQRSSETLEDVGRANVYMDDRPAVFGGFVIRGKKKAEYNPMFFRYLLASPYARKKVIPMGAGAQHFNIGQDGLSKVKLHFPILQEQQKIADLLRLINERISTQNKIIEKLETLIKGIRNYVLNNKLQNTTKKKLGELCTITTGKLDANAMKSEGLYPFFTCAEEVYRIDSFAFDTEALLVSGNGANLGYIHYYKGKFNAYQRTYVLSNFIEDIHYIQIYLEAYLHKRIALEKSTSNTPYIVLATLAEMPIIIPNIKIQKDISNKILILKSKLITEIHIRNCYKDMRQFLLSQMFI